MPVAPHNTPDHRRLEGLRTEPALAPLGAG